MNNKKLVICLILTLILSLSLVFACCNPDQQKEGPEVEQPTRTVTESKLTVYEGPKLLNSSSAMKVYVENQELFVYETRVHVNNDTGRAFTFSYPKTKAQVVNFDFEGKVHMKVEIANATALTDVAVRPLSYGITPTVNGNIVEFDLQYSANYTLEYNDGTVTDAAEKALHIFANPIEENPISADDVPANTIYIGPGVYSAGAIPMQSNQTLYLAGGAYVYGQVRAENLENITIRGRGIISGEIYDRKSASQYTLPIELRFCKNVKIEGITLLDPAGWAVTLYHSEDINIDNLKLITARANGDGISVQSCKNVLVKGGFMRTYDDTLVVKNTDRGNTENVTFDNCVVWTDLAQSMEVGFETNGSVMKDITFKNITVLHNFHKAVMSIHNCDDANITNVLYQSITVEDAQMLGDNAIDGENDYLIDMTIAFNQEWSKSEDRGTIDGVKIENIKVLKMADSIVCRFSGEGTGKEISNVAISGVEIAGEKIDTADKLHVYTNSYTKDITVSGVSYEVFGAGVALPYVAELANTNVATTVVNTRHQDGLEVPAFSILDVQDVYMGIARDLSAVTTTVTHGTGTTASAAHDDGSGDYQSAQNPVSNLFDGNRDTYFEAKAWQNQADEFVALTFDFGEKLTAGSVSVVRVYLTEDSSYVFNFNVAVFNKKNPDATSFARSAQVASYTATPATGNYFDILLSATLESSALQLRFFRTEGMTSQPVLKIAEIEIYPCSLTTTKSVTESTPFFDVYSHSNLVDGNDKTYWETSADACDGAYFIVDMGAVYKIKVIVMHLPPLLTWEARDQQIEILVSVDGKTWQTAVAKTVYTFDPMTGNVNNVELSTPIDARYIKLVWSSNSSSRYGAQLSELYVYGE